MQWNAINIDLNPESVARKASIVIDSVSNICCKFSKYLCDCTCCRLQNKLLQHSELFAVKFLQSEANRDGNCLTNAAEQSLQSVKDRSQ